MQKTTRAAAVAAACLLSAAIARAQPPLADAAAKANDQRKATGEVLDGWLLEQEASGGRYALETAYRSHTILTAILTKWNISARDYFMADASFEMASGDLKASFKAGAGTYVTDNSSSAECRSLTAAWPVRKPTSGRSEIRSTAKRRSWGSIQE